MRSLLLAASFLLAGLGHAKAVPPPDDQLWNEARLTYKLDSQFSVFASGDSRLTDNFGEVGRAAGRCGFGWQPTPYLTVMPSYLYAVHDPASSDSNVENRLCLLMSYRIPVKTATVTVSNTTEYRMRETAAASWRLRPKVTLSNPIGPDSLALSAFVANEVFYDNGLDAWTQDRVFGGFEKKVTDNMNVELYYCRQLDMLGTRSDLNIIGLTVRFTFGPKALPAPDEPDTQ